MANMSIRLGRLLNKPPATIEQIPGDGSDWLLQDHASGREEQNRPFLLVDGNLGIPQKPLYQTYMAAVPLFSQNLQKLRSRDYNGSPNNVAQWDDLVNLSAVLLLANPAHQTALNTRKRLVLAGVIDANHELQVTAALLTLRECSKQSILWHHRRWLISRTYKGRLTSPEPSSSVSSGNLHSSPLDTDNILIGVDIPPEILQAEFTITSRACETYSRNYHAWAHRYACAEALAALAGPATLHQAAHRTVLVEEFAQAQHWVERHISDYSAVQYLHSLQTFLQRAIPTTVLRELSPIRDISNSKTSAESRNVDIPLWMRAESLIESYPDYESLWLYLRAAVHGETDSARQDMRAQTLAFARRYLSTDDDGFSSAKYPRPLSSVNMRLVHINAYRFIGWLVRQDGDFSVNGPVVQRILAAKGDAQYLFGLLGSSR